MGCLAGLLARANVDRPCNGLCRARRLPDVLRSAIVRLRQSALPAPPRQCLASSAAGLELEPVTPARQDGIARFSRASCVRGMSVGLARRTLSSGKHDTNATGKSNGSSRLPAFSFRSAAATERRGRTTHATRISRRRTAIRREHGDARPRPREICSLSQSDMFTSAHRR